MQITVDRHYDLFLYWPLQIWITTDPTSKVFGSEDEAIRENSRIVDDHGLVVSICKINHLNIRYMIQMYWHMGMSLPFQIQVLQK